jgi:hypothetical protein
VEERRRRAVAEAAGGARKRHNRWGARAAHSVATEWLGCGAGGVQASGARDDGVSSSRSGRGASGGGAEGQGREGSSRAGHVHGVGMRGQTGCLARRAGWEAGAVWEVGQHRRGGIGRFWCQRCPPLRSENRRRLLIRVRAAVLERRGWLELGVDRWSRAGMRRRGAELAGFVLERSKGWVAASTISKLWDVFCKNKTLLEPVHG